MSIVSRRLLRLAVVPFLIAACNPAPPAPAKPAEPSKPAQQSAPAEPKAAAPAAKPVGPSVELKMIMSWDETNDTIKNVAVPFMAAVKEKSGGSITVTARGPEAVPPFEQFKPMRDGVFDLLFTHASYHNEVTTLGNGFDIASGSAAAHKECGSWDAIDDAYQKIAGVKFLAPIPAGHGYRMYMSRPIEKADLTGFKVRTSSFYDPMLKALNAVPVRMAFPEVYSALEKKVIDGTAWGGVGAYQAKWQEVAKYAVRPHFGETTSMIAMNLDSWKKLTPEQQAAVNAAVAETQERARRVMKDVDADEWTKLSAAGMQVSELKDAEAQKWLDAYYTNTLQEFIVNANPEMGPKIKATLDCVQAKKS